jgi:SAM-dependent methyltransferase
MNDYTGETYGERIADVYDQWYQGYDELMLATLSDLAQGGPVLELGIGTGRIALPLHQKGIHVQGIDTSEAMLNKLRSKPGADSIPLTAGNFADVGVEGEFSLIYVLFNTFFALLTQEEQLRCFQNVAHHLRPNGMFVIEAFVPDLTRFRNQQVVSAIKVSTDEVRLDVTQIDPVNQQLTSQHVVLSEQGVCLYPVRLRYAWPSELDLMARLAGLRLKERWGSWERASFTAESTKHISLYGHGP